MKKRRMKRSPQKVSRYRRVVGRVSHSIVAMAVVTTGLILGLASVGWAVDGKPLLAGRINTETQKTTVVNTGTGPALELDAASGPDIAVSSTDTVANLSAAMLDGKKAEHFATQNGLDTETAAREAADTTLQQNIDSEAASRAAADTTLQANIDAETAARAAADSTLQQNIDNEATARQNADQTLQNNINAEAAARAQGDQDVEAQLRSDLQQADDEPNDSDDPVDWSKLKGVPAGFADGEDAVGSSDPTAGLSGYEIVEVSSAYNTDNLKGAQAVCPSGKKVIGGGGEYSHNADTGGGSSADEIALQWSKPFQNSSQSGYVVMADDMSTAVRSSFSWRVIAYAICADVTSP